MVCSERELKSFATTLADVILGASSGVRVTVRVASRYESWMRRLGLTSISSKVSAAVRGEGYVFLSCGRRGGGSRESYLDHDMVEPFLDQRDQGIGEEPKERKELRSWTHYPHSPEMWAGRGLPSDVEDLMVNGASVECLRDRGAYEVRQYPFPSTEAMAECLCWRPTAAWRWA